MYKVSRASECRKWHLDFQNFQGGWGLAVNRWEKYGLLVLVNGYDACPGTVWLG